MTIASFCGSLPCYSPVSFCLVVGGAKYKGEYINT